MGADFWSGVQAILIQFSFLVAKNKIVDAGPAATGSQEGKGWCVSACVHACCRVVVEVGARTTSTLIRHSYTHTRGRQVAIVSY